MTTDLNRYAQGGTGPKPFDLVTYIMAYEAGDLDEEGFLTLFQYLVDSGQAWALQGHYGRTAAALIEAGRITPKGGRK